MNDLSKVLATGGIILIVTGAVLLLLSKLKFFGHLPGDIVIKKKNFSFYFPIVSCLVLSIVVSIVLWITSKFGK